MQDMRSLQRMGMMSDEMTEETQRSVDEFNRGEEDAVMKRLAKVDRMPTQEKKGPPQKHTPKHMKQPLAKNMRKRQRKLGAFA